MAMRSSTRKPNSSDQGNPSDRKWSSTFMRMETEDGQHETPHIPQELSLPNARKFRRIFGPSTVKKLSGWNWTPCRGHCLCRTPMISSSDVQAETSKSGLFHVSFLMTRE